MKMACQTLLTAIEEKKANAKKISEKTHTFL